MKQQIFKIIIFEGDSCVQGVPKETIDDINKSIRLIRDAQELYGEQDYFVSLVAFNNNIVNIFYECIPATEVVELTPETYQTKQCTTLSNITKIVHNIIRPKASRYDIIHVIITNSFEKILRKHNDTAFKIFKDELLAHFHSNIINLEDCDESFEVDVTLKNIENIGTDDDWEECDSEVKFPPYPFERNKNYDDF